MRLILACDPDGGIGYNNGLPWKKIHGDLPRFKRLTSGGIVVMGRNTWESIGEKPLPNRINVVVTTDQSLVRGSGIVITSNSDFSTTDDRFWLIGGAKLVGSSWDFISEIHLTKTHDHYTCDTHIDLSYIDSNFNLVYNELYPDHMYQIWKRK